MSNINFETFSYSVVGRLYSVTVCIPAGMTDIVRNTLFKKSIVCKGEKSMTFTEITKEADGLESLFICIREAFAKADKI